MILVNIFKLSFKIFRGECRRPICKSQPEESREGTTTALPLPDAHRMDWPSLVDTATRAMLIPGVESNEIR